MPGKDENSLFRIHRDVELADDVVYGNGSAWRRGHEIVRFNLYVILLQDLVDKVFCLLMTGRTGPALAKSCNLGGICECLLRVEGIVWCEGGGYRPP